MRPGNQNKNKLLSLHNELKKLKIYSLSKQIGFQQRKARKIKGLDLILSYYNCSIGSCFSLSRWASELGNRIQNRVSKQSVFERVDESFIQLCKELLYKSLDQKVGLNDTELSTKFKNIYIQDSTCIKLPQSLSTYYKGNYSKGEIKSLAKIQVVFNLSKGNFTDFRLTSYSQNDQSAANDILSFVNNGDMIIRDMGYFVLKSLKQIINKEAHFITPLRMDVKLYHPKNGKEIKLKNLVGNKQILKKTVLLGKEEKLPVTLIAIKVSRKTAESRRKRAILDRDRRKKNTIDKLYLLGWEIFVCSTNEISIENVKKIYGLRWQIEIIFKSWKSHLNIQKNIPTQLKRPFLPQAILLMSLLLAVVFIMPLYHKLSAMDKTTGISLLKLTLLITTGIAGIDWIIDLKKSKHLMYLSRYEKRKRRSFSDKIQSLS